MKKEKKQTLIFVSIILVTFILSSTLATAMSINDFFKLTGKAIQQTAISPFQQIQQIIQQILPFQQTSQQNQSIEQAPIVREVSKNLTNVTAPVNITKAILVDGYLDIATLKKEYAIGEQVLLTDPPEEKNIFLRLLNYFIPQKKDGQTLRITGPWPINITKRIVAASVAIGDVDQDNNKEIIIGEASVIYPKGNTSLYAWHHDGTNLTGYPISFTEAEALKSSPALGDLDNDGIVEIVIIVSDLFWGEDKLFILNPTGQILLEWEFPDPEFQGSVISSPALGDIDNDGDMEIIIGYATDFVEKKGYVYVLHHNGSLVNGWPIFINFPLVSTPALADLNKDGYLDIVVSADKLYVWNNDGTPLEGWPQDKWVYGAYSSPALGDLDNDGDIEIVIGSNEGYPSYIYVFHHNGRIANGWPKYSEAFFHGSPALADFDNDGDLEIFIANCLGTVFAFHHDGIALEGWPIKIAPHVTRCGGPGGYFAYATPALADIDGDEDIEIIFPSDTLRSEVYAWHHDGSLVEDWPKFKTPYVPAPINHINFASPIVDDIDNDGDIEIILGMDYFVYVWDLPGTYNLETMEWPMFQHDLQHTGNYHYKPKEILPKKSLINNTGNTTIQGYLLIKVQKKVRYIGRKKEDWIDVKIVVNDLENNNSRIIQPHTHLALDKIWFENNAYMTNEQGYFRVYAALVDRNGRPIRTRQGFLEDSYEFKVSSMTRPREID